MMMSKKELFNAKNNGKKIEAGLEIVVTKVGSFGDVDKDGHPVDVTALVSETGEVYTTISATVNSCIDLLSEIIDEEGKVTVQVCKNVSNGGREFYQLSIID